MPLLVSFTYMISLKKTRQAFGNWDFFHSSRLTFCMYNFILYFLNLVWKKVRNYFHRLGVFHQLEHLANGNSLSCKKKKNCGSIFFFKKKKKKQPANSRFTTYTLGMLKNSHEVVRHNLESLLSKKSNRSKKIRKIGCAWSCGHIISDFINKTVWIFAPKLVPKSKHFFLFVYKTKKIPALENRKMVLSVPESSRRNLGGLTASINYI